MTLRSDLLTAKNFSTVKEKKMNAQNFVISTAFQFCMDDLGWMEGTDGRETNDPSRTGIPRRHCLEDYITVETIGRAVGMRFGTTFILGEWDRHNLLRDVPRASKYGKNWDASLFLNVEEAEKIRDYVNSCEYFEIGLHGLLHEMWDENGKYIGGREYYIPEGDRPEAKNYLAPESMIRKHIDTFMEIYRDWGFQQKIRHFVEPGDFDDYDSIDTFASILSSYGIKYWHNHAFKTVALRSGVLTTPLANRELAPWNNYDLDPKTLPLRTPETAGIVMGHWVHFLRLDPKKNLEYLEDWKDFFRRQSEVFGIVMSKDIEFAHHQQLYKEHTQVKFAGDEIILDFTKADAIDPFDKKHPVYFSVKNGNEPIACEGGILSLYEEKGEFKNYKIERTDAKIVRIR
jgi:hypothetical protein